MKARLFGIQLLLATFFAGSAVYGGPTLNQVNEGPRTNTAGRDSDTNSVGDEKNSQDNERNRGTSGSINSDAVVCPAPGAVTGAFDFEIALFGEAQAAEARKKEYIFSDAFKQVVAETQDQAVTNVIGNSFVDAVQILADRYTAGDTAQMDDLLDADAVDANGNSYRQLYRQAFIDSAVGALSADSNLTAEQKDKLILALQQVFSHCA